MRFGKALAAALVAASLSSTPVMANPASALSVSTRAGAELDGENDLVASSILILVVVIAVVVGGVAAATGGGNGDDLPVSA